QCTTLRPARRAASRRSRRSTSDSTLARGWLPAAGGCARSASSGGVVDGTVIGPVIGNLTCPAGAVLRRWGLPAPDRGIRRKSAMHRADLPRRRGLFRSLLGGTSQDSPMADPIADALIIVLDDGASLHQRRAIGSLQRDCALWKALAEPYGRLLVVTHGGPEDLEVAGDLWPG